MAAEAPRPRAVPGSVPAPDAEGLRDAEERTTPTRLQTGPISYQPPTGWSWIGAQSAGELIASEEAEPSSFRSTDPATGRPSAMLYRSATDQQVEKACRLAWEAFYADRSRSPAERSDLLELIAENLESFGEDLLELTSAETGLSTARLAAERERACSTLRMFAAVARDGSWVEASIDHGSPARRPVPKPDLRAMLRPLGPVAVFGAGNFPLAYSSAGGDTASALAAGCPVVIKGHPGHPGAGEVAARAIREAARSMGFHPGTVSFLHAGGPRENTIGRNLVSNACIRAVGFTGSLRGGLAIEQIANHRPDPIPVFAEMGSTNPVFVLPHAAQQQGEAIGDRLASSVMNSVGQMCTCPGLIFVKLGEGSETVFRSMSDRINHADAAPMLNKRTRDALVARADELAAVPKLEMRAGAPTRKAAPDEIRPITGAPALYRTTFETFKSQPTLHEEVFGPVSIVVICRSDQEMVEAASLIQGSLTGSIFAAGHDAATSRKLAMILELRVGRLVFNGVPTGLEINDSTVHGGPFPATTAPHSTAQGSRAITRWCRPVAYQNAPDAMLPPELQIANPRRIRRREDGVLMDPPVQQ